MSELLREVNEESQELKIIIERLEPFLEQVPTLMEDAESLLGQVSAAVKAGKDLSKNPTITKVLAGLKVLANPDNRKSIAPEIKGIDPKFTIKDVISKSGEDKAANVVLARVADMWAKSEIKRVAAMIQSMATDPKAKEAFVNEIDKLRMEYSRLGGLIKNAA